MGAAISLSWEQTPLGRLSLKQLSLKQLSLKQLSLKQLSLKQLSLKQLSLEQPSTKYFVLFPPCLDFSLIHFYTFYEHVHKRE